MSKSANKGRWRLLMVSVFFHGVMALAVSSIVTRAARIIKSVLERELGDEAVPLITRVLGGGGRWQAILVALLILLPALSICPIALLREESRFSGWVLVYSTGTILLLGLLAFGLLNPWLSMLGIRYH